MASVADKEFQEKIVHIRRVAKVTKGGKNFHFTALVVVGNMKGKVGAGLGKSNEVPDAIRKAVEKAKKNLISIQPGDVKKTFAAIQESKNDLSFSPKTKIKDGIQQFIKWYKKYYET